MASLRRCRRRGYHGCTRVLSIGRSSFTFGQGVFKDELCVATAESVGVQMNGETRRSQPLTPAMIAWLEERLA